MALIAAFILAAMPVSPPLTDTVALVEINHHHDTAGRPIFTQAIYYDWCPIAQRHQVRAWRMIHGHGERPDRALIPRRDWRTGGYRAVWCDGDVVREVRAGVMIETRTGYDPEIVERDWLRREDRRGLACPQKPIRPIIAGG